ncbi:hypothetical protein QFZ30_002467 [Arthrobacter pascens]|uniref:hypothetical protein n=1 Tax=Arthrobacter pascens TaxID=1677 RepID=UPI00278EF89A|nr:hypothetical protein [Arthrobacter pascens]MDQ0679085.1 hypothetical protein [Arthrobacter pascens]
MTETPQDFDFDAWLDDAERPQRAVTVYQKAGLIADLDRLGEQINNADETEDVDGPSMGGGVGKLRAEYQKIAQQFHDSALTIRVSGHGDEEKREFAKANTDAGASGLAYIVLSDAITAPKVTVDQVKRLEKKLGPAQFGLILSAYHQASTELPTVSADFLPKPSTRDDGGES